MSLPDLRAFEVPDVWSRVYAGPVLDGDRVLLAVGWSWSRSGDRGDATVLVALDAATGAPRFRVTVPIERPAATEGEVGRPVVLPDGRILLAVYQWDTSLKILVLDRDGRLLRTDDLAVDREIELSVFGSDLGIKLWLEPLVVVDDVYLVSWAYRHREVFVQCRELETGALRWEAGERLLAADAETTWCEAGPALRAEGGALVARSTIDGRERRRLPPYPPSRVRGRSAVGLVGGRLVVVERLARLAAELARAEGILELAVATDSDDFDALEARWEREHPEPGEVLVAYGSDGHEAWRADVHGRVGSATCAEGVAFVTVGTTLLVASAEGVDRLEIAPGFVPVAFEAPYVWLSDGAELGYARRDAPGAFLWRVAVPVDPRTDRPTPTDRTIPTTAAAVSDGRVWLRHGTRLVVVERGVSGGPISA